MNLATLIRILHESINKKLTATSIRILKHLIIKKTSRKKNQQQKQSGVPTNKKKLTNKLNQMQTPKINKTKFTKLAKSTHTTIKLKLTATFGGHYNLNLRTHK
jgi:hypothetical protein